MEDLIKADFSQIKDGILRKYTELQNEVGVKYIPNLNDDEHLIADAAAYRINLLLQNFNHEFSTVFLQNASGTKLDKVANNFFGIERIEGTYPRATVTFTIERASSYDKEFYASSVFVSSEGKEAYLVDKVVIPAGTTKAQGELELREYIKTSNEQTNIPTRNLLFAYTTVVGEFINGAGPENDVLLRQRCIDSLHTNSTAGSKFSFEYYTKTADSRIEQVNAYEADSPGWVNICYYAKAMNDPDFDKKAVEDKIDIVLNNDFIRPLGTRINIIAATVKKYTITAKVTLPPDLDKTIYITRILEETKEELDKLSLLGSDITLYQILNIMGVDNRIKEVELSNLTEDITCKANEIAVFGEINVTVSE